jgi:hypothetical protein
MLKVIGSLIDSILEVGQFNQFSNHIYSEFNQILNNINPIIFFCHMHSYQKR